MRKLVLDIKDLSVNSDFLVADPLSFGTWVRLCMFCAEHLSGGLVEDCKEWDDHRWLRACGVNVAAIQACEKAKLVGWEGSGIRVFGYPEDQEKAYLAKSRGAGLARSKRFSKSLARKGCSDISTDVKTDITSLPFSSLPLQEKKDEFQTQALVLLAKTSDTNRPAFVDLDYLHAAAQGNSAAWRSFKGSINTQTKKFLAISTSP